MAPAVSTETSPKRPPPPAHNKEIFDYGCAGILPPPVTELASDYCLMSVNTSPDGQPRLDPVVTGTTTEPDQLSPAVYAATTAAAYSSQVGRSEAAASPGKTADLYSLFFNEMCVVFMKKKVSDCPTINVSCLQRKPTVI